jgi:hypothetical protein
MAIPDNWRVLAEGEHESLVECNFGHKFNVNNKKVISKCPTCSVSGFYKDLVNFANNMTGIDWVVVKPSHHISYIYGRELDCRIGAKYGKFYERKIKLDIEINNKFPA